jgi:hypothetical protein
MLLEVYKVYYFAKTQCSKQMSSKNILVHERDRKIIANYKYYTKARVLFFKKQGKILKLLIRSKSL